MVRMRHLVPRVRAGELLLAGAVVGPVVLLAALSHAVFSFELARLDVFPPSGIVDVGALQAFKEQTEALIIGVFLALVVATLAVVFATRSVVTALNLHGAAVLALLTVVVAGSWSLGASIQAARIGMATALWGASWILLALLLFAFLRAVPHRRWVWVTGTLAAAHFLVSLVVLAIAWIVTVEAAAVLSAVLGLAAAGFAVARRHEVSAAWGYSEESAVRLPEVTIVRLPFVAVYMVLLLGLMGATYQHQFDYRPVQGLEHYLLMLIGGLAGVLLFGALAWRGGRRVLLWSLPIATGAAMLLQAGFLVRWPAVFAVGLMLGAVFYLFQYLAETTQRMTREAAFLLSAGAVAVLGAGGSLAAILPAVPAFTPERILVLQVAALLVVFLVTPQLPETRASLRQEEAIQEYLEIARRVQEERH